MLKIEEVHLGMYNSPDRKDKGRENSTEFAEISTESTEVSETSTVFPEMLTDLPNFYTDSLETTTDSPKISMDSLEISTVSLSELITDIISSDSLGINEEENEGEEKREIFTAISDLGKLWG